MAESKYDRYESLIELQNAIRRAEKVADALKYRVSEAAVGAELDAIAGELKRLKQRVGALALSE